MKALMDKQIRQNIFMEKKTFWLRWNKHYKFETC